MINGEAKKRKIFISQPLSSFLCYLFLEKKRRNVLLVKDCIGDMFSADT